MHKFLGLILTIYIFTHLFFYFTANKWLLYAYFIDR